MGNAMLRLKQERKRSMKIGLTAEPEEDSTTSITNCSDNLSTAERSSVQSKDSELSSAANLFTWDHLQSVYYETIRKTSESLELQPRVVVVLTDIFNAIISNNVFEMCNNINYNLLNTDSSHYSYFEECAVKNLNSHTKNLSSEDKVSNHIFSMIFLHIKILNQMSNGNYDEVHNILQLIAISHTLMKVLPDYFQLMDIVVGNFLIANKLLTQGNAEYIVIYFNYVTTYINNYMKVQQCHDNPSTEDLTDDQHSTIVRENYRTMKKWYQLVNNIQQEITEFKESETFTNFTQNQVIEETPSSASTVPTEILAQNTFLVKYFVKKK